MSESTATAWIDAELAARRSAGGYRQLRQSELLPGGYVALDGKRLLNLSSNDYLGLATVLKAEHAAAGAGASRLIVGNHPLAAAVEQSMALHLGTECCLVFGCGFMANVGVIAALVGPGDVVYCDRLNHASIVDGIRLSGAKLKRYRHTDLAHLRHLLADADGYRRRLLVTDSVFSMDGDYAPLPELVALKQQYGLMLMVDEAHSGGILGAEGEGLTGHLGLSAQVDVLMGTFSKAYGVYGAYVAGDRQVCDYLVNACRTLIYTTALPPVLLALLQRSIEVVRADAWRRQRLQDNALVLHQALRDHGLSVPETASHILPLRIGDDVAAVSLSRRLEDAGLAAVAIRPPTVPAGTARLRLTVSAAHERADLVAAAETIAAQLRD